MLSDHPAPEYRNCSTTFTTLTHTFMAANSQDEFPTVHIDVMLLVVADQLLQCLKSVVVPFQDVSVLVGVADGEVVVHPPVACREVVGAPRVSDNVAAVSGTCLHGCLGFLLGL